MQTYSYRLVIVIVFCHLSLSFLLRIFSEIIQRTDRQHMDNVTIIGSVRAMLDTYELKTVGL